MTPRGREGAWARFGWILPTVWLVFLAFTIRSVLAAGLPAGATAAGLALVGLFAAVYVGGFVERWGARRLLGVPWNWAGLALLAAIAAALAPFIGLDALFTTPFIVAYACYLVPRRAMWAVGAGTIAGTLLLTAAAGRLLEYLFIVAIQAGVFAANAVQRALIDSEARAHSAARELAVVSERERVARDVHDGLGHTLTVMSLKAELAERLVDADPARAKAELSELHAMVRAALADVRATVGGLRSVDLPTQARALELALREAGLEVHTEGDPAAVDPALRPVLGWILREAGTNVLRHAHATSCRLSFSARRMAVEDDGDGLPEPHAPGNGLRGMEERLAGTGARLSVGAAPAGGTRVEVAW